MGYSSIGTPRFYVNLYEWANAIGMNVMADGSEYNPILNTLPVNPVPFNSTGNLISLQDYVPEETSTNTHPCFVAILGHDFTSNFGIDNTGANIEEIINRYPEGGYKGFSIIKTKTLGTRVYTANANAGSVVMGVCYTLPHSPELKLTLSHEMEGVKRIRTKGGVDLVNHKYTKPAMWTDENGVGGAAWELYSGTPTNQALSRVGRRTWSLSFNYLQGSDIFPMLSSLNPYESTSPSGTPYSDTNPADDIWNHIQLNWEDITEQWEKLDDDDPNYWWTGNTLLDSDNFYSQVVHKTQGRSFIFQPDSNNNNDLAICKFDMNSFKFSQKSFNTYSISLKIREVW